MKVLKYLALAYLLSLIVLISRATNDLGCINSITVQSINIERDQESVFAPNCYYGKEAKGIPVLGDKKLLKDLEMTIESFERALRDNRFFFKPNGLKVVIKDSTNLAISSKEIQMSYEQAKDLNLFRKSLIKSWVLNFASKKIRNDKFSQEVISDIFLYVFWNELDWDKEFNFKRWLKYVYSEKDICTTAFAPAERSELCDLIAENKTKQFDQISLWSMRPIVVNRILSYYDNMTLQKKLDFTKYWMKFAATYNGTLPEKNLNFSNFSSVYNSYMNQFVGKLMDVKFEENFFVDFIFEFHAPQFQTLVKQKSDLPFYMVKNILFKFNNNTFINLRNGSKISSKKSFAKHWVLVQNSLPELKEVKDLPADYLTIIQAKKDYNFSQFYEKIDDMSHFPWTEEFDSLTIYIPSLKLLSILAPAELRNKDIRALSLSPKVTKILGWNPVQVY